MKHINVLKLKIVGVEKGKYTGISSKTLVGNIPPPSSYLAAALACLKRPVF